MALFDIVDKNFSANFNSQTINTVEGTKERYTLTAEVDHLTQEELTAKILSMIQSDTAAEEILQTFKAEIQKETIPDISTVEERNAEVRKLRDEKLNAWAKGIQEENLQRAYIDGRMGTIWEEILGENPFTPPSSDDEQELAESETEEEIEYNYSIGTEENESQSLAVRGSTVYLNGAAVSRDELLKILSYPPRKLDHWDWTLIGGAALGVFGFSLWLSLLSCSLWKINHQ